MTSKLNSRWDKLSVLLGQLTQKRTLISGSTIFLELANLNLRTTVNDAKSKNMIDSISIEHSIFCYEARHDLT